MKFPSKLHYILSNVEKNDQDSIISWLPHGQSFKVHKRKEFESGMMKVYFNQTSFKSFQRQLNLWGFKWKNGAYSHELFSRNQQEKCLRMTRKQIKKTRTRTRAIKTGEDRHIPPAAAHQPSVFSKSEQLHGSQSINPSHLNGEAVLEMMRLEREVELSLHRVAIYQVLASLQK